MNEAKFNKTYYGHLHGFLILLLLSSIAWFGGPYLKINHHLPLQDFEKRIYLIAILWLTWMLKILWLDSANPRNQPDVLKQLKLMKARFKGAIAFLKKTTIIKNDKKISLYNLPWYLLVGTKQSGKSSLLLHSSLSFILSKQFKDEETKSSDHHDWWVTRDSTFIDVPSHYFFNEKERYLSSYFFKLLKKYGKKNKPHSIIFTLNLPELIKYDSKVGDHTFLIPIKKCIEQLIKEINHPVSFYFVITKCDLIPGFMDFFGDLSQEEQNQPWGISIPPIQKNEKLVDVFSTRFNALIKRLNQQIIWRLHQERNPTARPFIKDFPLQIERLKESIVHLLKTIQSGSFNLQGVYLVSALQPQEDKTPQVIAQTQAIQLLNPIPQPRRSFFIKHVMLHALPIPSELPKVNKYNLFVYSTALTSFVVCSSIIGNHFLKSLERNRLLHHQLATDVIEGNKVNLTSILQLLNGIEFNLNNTNKLSFNLYSKKTQAFFSNSLYKTLTTLFIPSIKNILEKELTYQKDPSDLYSLLKAYLMLKTSDSAHLAYISQTLLSFNAISFEQKQLVERYLRIALSQSPVITLDDLLISKTRHTLSQLPKEQLSLLILKNNDEFAGKEVKLNNFLLPHTTTVPAIYTSEQFGIVLSSALQAALKEALTGNAILGPLESSPSTNNAALSLLSEKEFIKSYAHYWETLLNSINVPTFQNLQETNLFLTNLTKEPSPLIELLELIQHHAFKKEVIDNSIVLKELNEFMSEKTQGINHLYQVFINLKVLQNNLAEKIQSSILSKAKTSTDALSHSISATQLTELSKTSPALIKNLLDKINAGLKTT